METINEYWEPGEKTAKVFLEFTPKRYNKFMEILKESGVKFPRAIAQCITCPHLPEKGHHLKVI